MQFLWRLEPEEQSGPCFKELWSSVLASLGLPGGLTHRPVSISLNTGLAEDREAGE
jgi:hypothetical protein